jgi:hypothetical protein
MNIHLQFLATRLALSVAATANAPAVQADGIRIIASDALSALVLLAADATGRESITQIPY